MLLLIVVLAACAPIQAPSGAPAAAPAGENDAAAAGPVAELAGEFELVQLIVDFPPGTWTPLHTHGGMLLVTVLQGEQTVRDEQGQETLYKAALLPKGANLSTTKEGINTNDAPPGPTTVYQNRLAVTEPLGEFELVQLIVDFPAGTWTPAHTHGGELLVTVLNGEQTVRDEQGNETIYKAGESFIETPGEYLEIGNAGQDLVTVSALALLPKGAALSTTKEGVSTDNAPPGPTTLYQARLPAHSVAAP
jgi:quercetin dioxygenase-like cupin family protein